jgi:hypothetical protein
MPPGRAFDLLIWAIDADLRLPKLRGAELSATRPANTATLDKFVSFAGMLEQTIPPSSRCLVMALDLRSWQQRLEVDLL